MKKLTLVAGIIAGLLFTQAARAADEVPNQMLVSDTAALLLVYSTLCHWTSPNTQIWLAQLIQRSDRNIVDAQMRLYVDMMRSNWQMTCTLYSRMLFNRQKALREGIYQ